jgi:hypothetical protein
VTLPIFTTWDVLVDVYFLVVVQSGLRNIYYPVCGHCAVPTLALLEHFFFTYNSNPYVVVFAPNALEMVLDEREVVAAFRASVVDTYSV